MKATAEQKAAYVSGRCVDCKAVGYSAGRPRCNTCHAAYLAVLTPPNGSLDALDHLNPQPETEKP